MHLDQEEYIIDLIEHVNNLTKVKFDSSGLKAIGAPGFKNEVHDAPRKFYLPGVTPENNAVLMVSRKAHPDFIDRAINNSNLARGMLSDQHSAVILEPINYGRFQGLSYAVWPEHKPVSNNRLIRKIQIRRLQPKVFLWLQSMAKDSMVGGLDEKSIDQYFQSPLECVAANPRLSQNVKAYAIEALKNLQTRQWIPITVLQHADFWFGNILLLNNDTQSNDNKYDFCIIDWGGASIHGVPVFDLVRYCISIRISLSSARDEFLKYALTLQIEPGELFYYLICALGQIGMNLEQFPEDRYLEMCEKNISYLQSLKINRK